MPEMLFLFVLLLLVWLVCLLCFSSFGGDELFLFSCSMVSLLSRVVGIFVSLADGLLLCLYCIIINIDRL